MNKMTLSKSYFLKVIEVYLGPQTPGTQPQLHRKRITSDSQQGHNRCEGGLTFTTASESLPGESLEM